MTRGACSRPRRLRTWARILRALSLLSLGVVPAGAAGQRPAELVGRVRDVGGAPIEAATVELVEIGERVLSDGSGRYRFRSVSTGRYTLRVTRIGFQERLASVDVLGGRTQEMDIQLIPAPVELDEVAVTVAGADAQGTRVGREEIERSGARTAGDVLRAFPGVVVRSTSPGGPITVSVRGSAPDAVLVLVDGVVLNDPLTGEADLSTLPARTIESVTLLPGAQSARYGPRAEAGVVIVATRLETSARELSASVGSLGARSASAVWGASTPLRWSAGVDWSALEGVFDFDIPRDAGGGSGRRQNADARLLGAWAGLLGRVVGGDARIRAGAEWTRRGLPGRSYAPSPDSRQTVDRLQGSASWQRLGSRSSVRVALSGSQHLVHFRDDDPPFGLPYRDSARVNGLDARAEVERALSAGGGGAGGGVEARWQSIDASSLAESAPGDRLELGLFGHGAYPLRLGGAPLTISAHLRADHARESGWTASHTVTLASSLPGVDAHVAARSSFSPPALADQYFRAQVGVEPNPALAAERVPWEVESGLSSELALGPLQVSGGVTAYRGDVRGMIVWSPDFRFVWSPRNVDVRRTGLESRGALATPDGRARVRLSHSYTRVVYDQPPPEDDVQVIYRPRHTGAVELDLASGAWRLDASARFTGVRYPVPARLNALPSFWTSSGALSRSWPVRGWTLTTALRADRLLGERESLIFGFPEPGRTLRLDFTLEPSRNPSTRALPR